MLYSLSQQPTTTKSKASSMESAPFSPEMERLITSEEKERLERALASYGLVDAMLCDQPQTTERYNDGRWAVESDYNPDIILGID